MCSGSIWTSSTPYCARSRPRRLAAIRLPDLNEERRSRTGAAFKSFRGAPHILAPLDEIARHLDGTFVVVVEVADGQYRRRCFLTAKSAERAAHNATQRGENATVYLAELKPLWKVIAGGEAT